MAIPVRIEAKAWTDPRYQALALELGMARARHALIAVADIWQWQTEHYSDDQPTYCVPRAVIVGALEHRDGPEAMVAAGLAEAMGDGTFRIRGGMDDRGKSRIDWLHRDRMAQAERGRRRADRAATEGRQGGKFTSREPAGHQPEGVQTPAANQPATSSPDSGLRTNSDPERHTPRARDRVAELAEQLHQTHAVEGRKLADSIPGCGAVSIGGGQLTGARLAAVREIVGRWIDEAAELDVEREPYVLERMAQLVAIRAAKARDRKSVTWWAPATFWGLDGIEKDLLHPTPEAAVEAMRGGGARPGHGPRDQPRPRAQGQFVATTVPNRPDGEIPL